MARARRLARERGAELTLLFAHTLIAQEKGQTKISLSTKVDPSLVSGITVEIGDKFLDYSVATQLKKLQSLLKDGI